jgi:hypothetical protein
MNIMKTSKYFKLWLLVLATLPFSLFAQSETKLSIETFTINAGETQTMIIDLDNPDMEVTLVQFDLSLPEGLTVSTDDDALEIGRTTWKKHSLDANEDNTRFLLHSGKNNTLEGTSGAIIYIKLVAAATFKGGTIALRNIEIVSPTEQVVHPNDVEMTIGTTQTTVTIVANNQTMLYGDAVPTLTYTVTEGEADGTPELSCEATQTSPVGTYPIHITKGTLKNDVVNLTDGTLTINKAPLTITAKSYTIKQGEALPEFEVTYSGFKNGEDESVLTTKPTITCKATADSEPGDYEITVSGAEATNYAMNYVAGKLTIVKKNTVVIVANNQSTVYGNAIPELTYTVTEGEADGVPELTCEATQTSPVGTYTIHISKGTLKNDEIKLIDGTLTINKAPLTITANSYTITQGDQLPEFEVTYSGFKNGEDENVLKTKPTITCNATADSEPGSYEIIVDGADAANYDITYASGWLTIEKPVVIITDEQGSDYEVGEDNTVTFVSNTEATGTFEIPQTIIKDGVTYTVTAIAEMAFLNNTNLTEIVIPESITAIGGSAFEGCSNLASITIKSTTPPTVYDDALPVMKRASNAFLGVDKEKCILYVPVGCVAAYTAAEGWNEFHHILEIGTSSIHVLTGNNQFGNIYDINGRLVRENTNTFEGLSKGIYIVNGRKIIVK